jgi:hypothetical protein
MKAATTATFIMSLLFMGSSAWVIRTPRGTYFGEGPQPCTEIDIRGGDTVYVSQLAQYEAARFCADSNCRDAVDTVIGPDGRTIIAQQDLPTFDVGIINEFY